MSPKDNSDAHIPHSSQHANRISPETPLEGWNILNFLPCRSQLLIPFPTQDPVAHSLAQAFIPWQPGTQCPSLHRAAPLPQGTNQQRPPPQHYRHTALNLTQDTTTFTFTRSTRGTACYSTLPSSPWGSWCFMGNEWLFLLLRELLS